MKILLNLLPPEKKSLAEQRMHFRFFVWQVFLLFALELFFLGILVGMFILLDFEKKHQEWLGQEFVGYQTEDQKLRQFEEKFQRANELASATLSVNQNHFFFTSLFVLLDQHVNDSIVLSRVATQDFQLSLAGVANTRDDLIAFNESLKNEECFSDVRLPFSNLLAKTDVDFQMDITLKESCLHTPTL